MDSSKGIKKNTSTSTFTGTITTQTVNLSSIAYDDLSGLDKFKIKGGKTV